MQTDDELLARLNQARIALTRRLLRLPAAEWEQAFAGCLPVEVQRMLTLLATVRAADDASVWARDFLAGRLQEMWAEASRNRREAVGLN